MYLVVNLVGWLNVEAGRQAVQLGRQAGQPRPVVGTGCTGAAKVVLLKTCLPFLA